MAETVSSSAKAPIRRLCKYVALLPVFLVASVALYLNADHQTFYYDSVSVLADDVDSRLQHQVERWADAPLVPSQRLSFISFMLNARLNQWLGVEPFDITSFLVVNALIHGMNAWVVFLLVRKLLQMTQLGGAKLFWLSLGLSLLFLAHPLHAASVAYIIQRRGTLAVLFYLLAFLSYLHARETHRPVPQRVGYAALVLACFWLSIHSKPFTLTLPVALLTFELVLRAADYRRFMRSLTWFVPCMLVGFGLMLAYLWHRGLFDPTGVEIKAWGGKEAVQWTFWQHVYTEAIVFVHYWKLILLPLPQWMAIDHMGWIAESLFDRGAIYAIAFHGAMLIGAIVLAVKRYPLAAAGILWFYVTLIPYMFLPQRAIMVEYKTYLPSIGFIMILAELLRLLVLEQSDKTRVAPAGMLSDVEASRRCEFVRRGDQGRPARAIRVLAEVVRTRWQMAFVAVMLVTFLFAGMTVHRNRIYQDGERLWQDTIAKHPENYLAHHRLGVVYLNRGQYAEAIEPLQKSLELRSQDASAQHQLGVALAAVGRDNDAMQRFRRAIEIDPDYGEAYYDLGELLRESGDLTDAISALQKAVELQPASFLPHWGLASAYIQAGQWDNAADSLRRAIEANNESFEAHYALANVEVRRKQPRSAADAYQAALKLNQQHGEAHERLAFLLAQADRLDEAIHHLESAIDHGRRTSDNLENLAVLLRQAGRADEAITRLQQGVELDPSDQDAQYKLGLLLTEQNRPTEAIKVFEYLLTLNPNHQGALRALRRLYASD